MSRTPILPRWTLHRSVANAMVILGVGLLGLSLGLPLGFSLDADAATSKDPGSGEFPIPMPDLIGLDEAVIQQITQVDAETQASFDKLPDAPARAQLWADLGNHYAAYEIWGPAEGCYRNAEALQPEQAAWPYALGFVYQSRGNLPQATAAYDRSLETSPDSTPARLRRARALADLGNLPAARQDLEWVIARQPNSPAALAQLGELDITQERFEDAVPRLEQALALAPQANRLNYSLGLAYRGLGQRKKARQALALNGSVGVAIPDPFVASLEALKVGDRILVLRGGVAYRAGRYEEAQQAFAEALRRNPKNTTARINHGTVLAQLGQRAEGIAELEKAVLENPRSLSAWTNLNLLLIEEGRLEKAQEAGAMAIALDPKDRTSRLAYGQALYLGDKASEALTQYQTALALDPDDPEALRGEGLAFSALNDFPNAIRSLEKGYQNAPGNGRIASALARLYAACPQGNLRSGRKALELAVLVHRASPTPFHTETVAMALAESGRCSEAANWQRKVITADLSPSAETVAQEALRRYRQGTPCRPPITDHGKPR